MFDSMCRYCTNGRGRIAGRSSFAVGRTAVVVMALLQTAHVRAGVLWVDSFDQGVGRFSHTLGSGDTRFVYYPGGSIEALFVRDGGNDRRYAPIGQTFDAGVHTIGFSFRFVPFATSVGGGGETGIGFWNSASDNAANRIVINFATPAGGTPVVKISGNYADGAGFADSTTVPFSFLRTYAVTVHVDGPAHRVTADVVQLPDEFGSPGVPTHVGSLALDLQPDRELVVDSIGFGGGFGQGQAMLASIDDVALVVPEPTSLVLLVSTGAILGLRRRGH